MDFDTNIGFLQETFWQIMLASGPILFIALVVGLFVGIIQAATSINEMTLSFVPKLFLVLLTFGIFANFMLIQLSDFFYHIFERIRDIG